MSTPAAARQELPAGDERLRIGDRLEAAASAVAAYLRLEPHAPGSMPVRLQHRALHDHAAPPQEMCFVSEVLLSLQDRDTHVLH